MRNEYENGMLKKLTLADGSVYTYAYDSSNPEKIGHATVQSPDGRVFTIEIGKYSAVVHESTSPVGTSTKLASASNEVPSQR
jgi:hypothetical protein